MSKSDKRTVSAGPTRMAPSEAFVETMVSNGFSGRHGVIIGQNGSGISISITLEDVGRNWFYLCG